MVEAVIQAAKKRYDISDALTEIEGGYQSHVYHFTKADKKYILRLTDVKTRTLEQVKAEVDFCNYLLKEGLSIPKIIPSKLNHFVEQITFQDSAYVVVVFTFAKGNKLTYPEYLKNTKLYQELGVLTGKLHAASANYTPKTYKRNTYTRNYYLSHVKTYIPSEKVGIHQAHQLLIDGLNTLPKDCAYGLIHGDINNGNFHFDDEIITLFDFDECQYSWYIEDIAIALYYTVFVFNDDSAEERHQQALRFMKWFMKGYAMHFDLPHHMFTYLPLFLKVRELIVSVGIHKKWDLSNLNAWQKDYLRDSTKRIENGQPIVDIKTDDFL